MHISAAQPAMCELLEDMISEVREYENECPICYEQLDGRQVSPVIVTECQHRYHVNCFAEHMRETPITSRSACPICRQFPLPAVRESGALLHEDSPYCEDLPLQACRTGDVETLQKLLTQDKTIARKTFRSAVTGKNVYLLYVTAFKGHLACVQTLIAAGADVNAALADGSTPMYIAARKNYSDILQTLLNAGADPNAAPSEDGITPLHIAVYKNNIDCLPTLLNGGANINAVTASRSMLPRATPLHIAVWRNSIACLEPLLNGGASIKATTTSGATPLKLAVLLNNETCRQALITAEENLKAHSKKRWRLFSFNKKPR
ncbi:MULTISPECIES: ankyrin repeat domain-containing protein [unclassified Endozoicomonas]|uniref:ankyrin repeat domain-containing protein n=1 Tax=unclassified Endozoicomonas TaxID=2644528 RepID=UPI003BB667D4